MSNDRVYNFSSGPATMPETVLRRTQDALWSLDGCGIGVAEISHRSPEFDRVIEGAEARLRELMSIPSDYAVMFLQGGASSQFYMLPASFLGPDQTADFLHTGAWSKKAIAEAKRYGAVHVAGSSEDSAFDHIPRQLSFSASPAYVHITSNNTIAGTQWASVPDTPEGAPLFCDASSDILSRPIDVTRYGALYAGAQKNLGPSGVTVVIMRRDLIESASRDVPTMMQYRTHADKGSRFNTPPTLAIYMVSEVLAWIAEQGGLEAMAEANAAKAGALYRAIDASDFWTGTARTDSRSLMNVCFRAPTPDLDAAFVSAAEDRGFATLKGHRSVGGLRASIYNAMPMAGVEALIAFMGEFERANG